MTLQEFTNQFSEFISHNPGNWYVGIASNPEDRLFNDHNVDRTYGVFIYDNASTEENARAVEKVLIESFDAKGNPGGGGATTTWVYAYQITQNTVE